jgi:DNA polymerase-3 subunit epsilon
MYAIVDIETTGGYASAGSITEIAVLLHDGTRVTDRFETLIRPVHVIPRYIESLTGISNAMVADAPAFADVAAQLHQLLHDKIFIAHNVSFDYSFVKQHFKDAGYTFNVQRLCTVRLSRKAFPGQRSYSLGSLCRALQIPVENRHRAGGDAAATVLLFEKILAGGGDIFVREALKRQSKEQALPIHLPREQVTALPSGPGVYYFHNEKDKIMYVGKAKDLRKRVYSHFANNATGRQKQDFVRRIHRISYQTCTTELMALILESAEIRRLWPEYNKSQKRFEQAYGLYVFEDRNGYLRLAIEKKKKHLQPAFTFYLLAEGQQLLRQLIRTHGLCPKLCFLQTDNDACTGMTDGYCAGACERREAPDEYNNRVLAAISELRNQQPSFVIMEEDEAGQQVACILMERGQFYGMGYLSAGMPLPDLSSLKEQLTPYPHNDYVKGLILQYATRYPDKILELE